MRTPHARAARRLAPVGALLALAACSVTETQAPREFPSVVVEGEPMYDVQPRDAIPAIDDPVLVSAGEADAYYEEDEPVLGVVARDGSARAYSTWHLEGHEVVNDVVDGEPIAATW